MTADGFLSLLKKQTMVLSFIVVNCGTCERFQVIQKPKSKKFVCRVCGGKNSVRRVFGESAKAKDMRLICQQLSMRKGNIEEEQEMKRNVQKGIEEQDEYDEVDDEKENDQIVEDKESFWDQFRSKKERCAVQEDREEEAEAQEESIFGGKRLGHEGPNKRRRSGGLEDLIA